MNNDGGAAFPRSLLLSECQGMSLRDYFAGQKMSTIADNSLHCRDGFFIQHRHKECASICAKICYDYADAMILEREISKEEKMLFTPISEKTGERLEIYIKPVMLPRGRIKVFYVETLDGKKYKCKTKTCNSHNCICDAIIYD